MMLNQKNRILICQLDDVTVGIDLNQVRSIQRTRGLRRNEGDSAESIPHFTLVTTQGDVPVISLALSLGIASREALANQKILIIEDGENVWGLLVERVQGAVKFSAEMRHHLPINAINESAPLFSNVLNYRGDAIALELDLAQFHPEQAEMRAIVAAFMQSGSDGELAAASPAGLNKAAATDEESEWIVPSINNLANQKRQQLIVFNVHGLDDYGIGLSTVQVSEIIMPQPIMPIPHAPSGVLGLVFWRETVVTVIDIAEKLGHPTKAGENRRDGKRLLITRARDNELPAAYVINDSSRLVRLPTAHRIPPQNQWPVSDYVRALFELPDQLVIIPQLQPASLSA